jgi:hypothetical protein
MPNLRAHRSPGGRLMGRQSDAGRFVTDQEWLWPIVELAQVLLYTVAHAYRRRLARTDARHGIHANHSVCRHGKAVNW